MGAVEHVRELSQRYPYLQGLKLVPVGLWIAGIGVVTAPRWSPAGSGANPVVFIVAAVLAVLLSVAGVAISRYYESRFGKVTMSEDRNRKDLVVNSVFVVLLLAATVLDLSLELEVSLFGFVFVLLSLAYWRYAVGVRPYHWIVAAATTVVAVSPALGWTEPGDDILMWMLITIGAGYVITGVLDHAHLVGRLKELRTPDGE